jgi:hypothetical protein
MRLLPPLQQMAPTARSSNGNFTKGAECWLVLCGSKSGRIQSQRYDDIVTTPLLCLVACVLLTLVPVCAVVLSQCALVVVSGEESAVPSEALLRMRACVRTQRKSVSDDDTGGGERESRG